jgi:hypothetical protein
LLLRYFFFAAFLVAFFVAFLAAFFVAIVSILPIRVLQQRNAAVNECIDFSSWSVKKKITNLQHIRTRGKFSPSKSD